MTRHRYLSSLTLPEQHMGYITPAQADMGGVQAIQRQ